MKEVLNTASYNALCEELKEFCLQMDDYGDERSRITKNRVIWIGIEVQVVWTPYSGRLKDRRRVSSFFYLMRIRARKAARLKNVAKKQI